MTKGSAARKLAGSRGLKYSRDSEMLPPTRIFITIREAFKKNKNPKVKIF